MKTPCYFLKNRKTVETEHVLSLQKRENEENTPSLLGNATPLSEGNVSLQTRRGRGGFKKFETLRYYSPSLNGWQIC